MILVTGANGALGSAIGRAFLEANEGNFLCLGVHTRRKQAEALESQYRSRCECVSLDVTSAENWRQGIEQILGGHGRLDVLVNNAGGHADALLGTMPHTDWQKILALNLDSVFLGCQAVLPAMISQKGGRIVNVASLSALLPPPGQVNYAAAKAGVVALTQSLAKEVARIGITVNAVCPGYIETEALAQMDPAERKAFQSRIPMRRFGRPEEVAAAVCFLACESASYITGSILKIDGGLI